MHSILFLYMYYLVTFYLFFQKNSDSTFYSLSILFKYTFLLFLYSFILFKYYIFYPVSNHHAVNHHHAVNPSPSPSRQPPPRREPKPNWQNPIKPNRQNPSPSRKSTENPTGQNHHAEIGKPKPPNQPVLSSTTTSFRASIENSKRRESTEKKREKKSNEMREKEKNRRYILDGPRRRNVIFNQIQSVYKVHSSFSFVKSYCTLCKKIWR